LVWSFCFLLPSSFFEYVFSCSSCCWGSFIFSETPGWSQTREPPAKASQVLGLQCELPHLAFSEYFCYLLLELSSNHQNSCSLQCCSYNFLSFLGDISTNLCFNLYLFWLPVATTNHLILGGLKLQQIIISTVLWLNWVLFFLWYWLGC
jgi:hypothetical protein